MVSAVVCFDAGIARRILGAGLPVVMCGPGGATLGPAEWALPAGGRLAVLIGDPSDEGVVAAALAMAGELFGNQDVAVVRTETQAISVASGHAPNDQRG